MNMNEINRIKKGGNSKTIVSVVVLVVVLALLYFVFGAKNEDSNVDNQMEEEVKTEQNSETTENSVNTMAFSGKLLGGDSETPLLDFVKEDYDRAIESGKLVTLYFYANWCPTCKLEFPKMESAFDELNSNDVIGFRVNFNDNDTDEFEKELAKEFGVAYQHTKVFVRGGERILKSPETWNKERYLSEINALVK